VLCGAIDIGSNTTRLLVAEPHDEQLKMVMQQRAYTRITKAANKKGKISAEKIAEVAEVVATQRRLAEELGAEVIRVVATAAIRDAKNSKAIVEEINELAEVEVDVLSEEEEGRLAFLGATKALSHPPDGEIAVVDVGGGSSEVVFGTTTEGATHVQSFPIGSGMLAEEFLEGDPPSASEIRALRDHIDEFFEDVKLPQPAQAVAVGGSSTSLRTLVGAVLEYETLERAIRVLATDEIFEVARRFELDSRRVRILPSGVLLLEKISQMLGQPLQIGKGGLREGIILDLIQRENGDSAEAVAA
jgi:exopolyphosphatase / guanosine-5'-triphosphate,3'-diphosphate pyrophosphatase